MNKFVVTAKPRDSEFRGQNTELLTTGTRSQRPAAGQFDVLGSIGIACRLGVELSEARSETETSQRTNEKNRESGIVSPEHRNDPSAPSKPWYGPPGIPYQLIKCYLRARMTITYVSGLYTRLSECRHAQEGSPFFPEHSLLRLRRPDRQAIGVTH